MNCAKICENCSFYDEIAPSNHFRADEFGLGMCTIQRDRLPLWAKDCCCETVVHGDWADCPTWTIGAQFVCEPEKPVEAGCYAEAPQTAPRWLPMGTVVCGTVLLSDQFKAVLEFAEEHNALLPLFSVTKARAHWDLDFDPDSGESFDAFHDLCDALCIACPPFTYFGSHPGNSSDFGVWPDDEAIEEAIYKNGTGRMCRLGTDLEISVASEAFDWIIVINDDGSYRELYECKKGVKSLVWKLK